MVNRVKLVRSLVVLIILIIEWRGLCRFLVNRRGRVLGFDRRGVTRFWRINLRELRYHLGAIHMIRSLHVHLADLHQTESFRMSGARRAGLSVVSGNGEGGFR